MCGIAGFINISQEEQGATLDMMMALMKHRGPDGCGKKIVDNVGLCSTRLAVMDPTARGAQPMTTPDGKKTLVFNGEIYNAREVASQLRDVHLISGSDTEVLLHALDQWGVGCLDRLNGMFAFAFYDSERAELLLARDRLGVKPLYIHRIGSTFTFASEVKVLFGDQNLRFGIREDLLAEYLHTRFVAGAETLFQGIYQVEPAHFIRIDTRTFTGEYRQIRYWQPILQVDVGHTLAARTEQFREQFKRSVAMQTIADVPIGTQLSAGLDSTAIAAELRTLVGSQLTGFTIGFHAKGYDESSDAARFARDLGIGIEVIRIDEQQFIDQLPRLSWCHDEPLSHPSAVGVQRLSAVAKRSVKVLLSGEGADEILCGYGPRYQTFLEHRPGGRRQPWFESLLKSYLDHSRINKGRALAKRKLILSSMAASSDAEFAVLTMCYFPESYRSHIAHLDPERHWLRKRIETYRASQVADRLLSCQMYDLKTYLPALLMRQDKMSMAESIENRVPFLDHDLVNLCLGMEQKHKIVGGRTKVLLREAMRGVLPSYILRRQKHGFGFPLSVWFQSRLGAHTRDVLLSRGALERPWIFAGFKDIIASPRAFTSHEVNELAWIYLSLEHWTNTYSTARDHVQKQLRLSRG